MEWDWQGERAIGGVREADMGWGKLGGGATEEVGHLAPLPDQACSLVAVSVIATSC